MNELVECYSGSAYADKPTALTWQGQRLIITEILSQGRTPQKKWFQVRTADGLIFELSCLEIYAENQSEHEWQIHQLQGD